MLTAPALSIGWAYAARATAAEVTGGLLPYCFVALAVQLVLRRVKRRILVMAVSADASESLKSVVGFLVAIAVASLVARPPFPPLLAVPALVTCGIACYVVLPISRAFIRTLGVVAGKVLTLASIALASPFFFGLTLLFSMSGGSVSSQRRVGSIVLGNNRPDDQSQDARICPNDCCLSCCVDLRIWNDDVPRQSAGRFIPVVGFVPRRVGVG